MGSPLDNKYQQTTLKMCLRNSLLIFSVLCCTTDEQSESELKKKETPVAFCES